MLSIVTLQLAEALATKAQDVLDAARPHRDEIVGTEVDLEKTEAAIEHSTHTWASGPVTEDMSALASATLEQGPSAW